MYTHLAKITYLKISSLCSETGSSWKEGQFLDATRKFLSLLKSFHHPKFSVSEPSLCFVTRLFLCLLHWWEGIIWWCAQNSQEKLVSHQFLPSWPQPHFSCGDFLVPWNSLPTDTSSVAQCPNLLLQNLFSKDVTSLPMNYFNWVPNLLSKEWIFLVGAVGVMRDSKSRKGYVPVTMVLK